MSFFQPGLSHDELKKAYRELVKKHHPDVGGDTATMQRINEEYDKYFEVSAKSVWTTPSQPKSEREFIVFMVRQGRRLVSLRSPRGGMFAMPRVSWASPAWTDAQEGFASVHEDGMGLVGRHIRVRCPSGRMTAEMLIKNASPSYSHNIYRCHIGDSEFYLNSYNDVIAVDDENRPFKYNLFTAEGANKMPIGTDMDFIFHEYQDCTYDEFLRYHDVDNPSDFHETLGMKEFEPFVDNGAISYLIRKGGLKIFVSRFDRSVKYGYFSMSGLLPLLKNLDIEDIEEAQDYLDEINADFDEKVKAKIKKGKLKIVV